MKRVVVAFALLTLLLVQGAAAKIITQCGASEGYAYFFEGGLIAEKDAGWQKDGISGGGFQFISADDGSDPDIIITDVIGTRTRADGANVTLVPGSGRGFYLVLSIYPSTGTVDHYLFRLDDQGHGRVAWGTTRSGAVFNKSSLMISKCSAPN
jgi:hypothetical protein